MPAILIIGASRGIGLGLVTEFLARGWRVTATQRSPSPALAATGARIESCDIDDDASVAALAATLAGTRFDHILVNAGIMGNRGDTASNVSREALTQIMWTNAVAPVRAARALLPLLAEGGAVGFMTSILGSVALRSHAHAELYSASKAALNSLSRGFAAENRQLAVLNLHPGWVKTDMGGEGADIDVPTSVRGLADVISAARPPGQVYLDYSGKTLPW
ncbi:MAG: SDR family oxidoreductase [Sphingomonadales bacterium]|jgi:NAD(P)-dependent dehydrogenase (short-subunit alcohol dehydrogenase family)